MGENTPEHMELECPGCGAYFRLRPKNGKFPERPIPCPKCGTSIPIPTPGLAEPSAIINKRKRRPEADASPRLAPLGGGVSGSSNTRETSGFGQRMSADDGRTAPLAGLDALLDGGMGGASPTSTFVGLPSLGGDQSVASEASSAQAKSSPRQTVPTGAPVHSVRATRPLSMGVPGTPSPAESSSAPVVADRKGSTTDTSHFMFGFDDAEPGLDESTRADAGAASHLAYQRTAQPTPHQLNAVEVLAQSEASLAEESEARLNQSGSGLPLPSAVDRSAERETPFRLESLEFAQLEAGLSEVSIPGAPPDAWGSPDPGPFDLRDILEAERDSAQSAQIANEVTRNPAVESGGLMRQISRDLSETSRPVPAMPAGMELPAREPRTRDIPVEATSSINDPLDSLFDEFGSIASHAEEDAPKPGPSFPSPKAPKPRPSSAPALPTATFKKPKLPALALPTPSVPTPAVPAPTPEQRAPVPAPAADEALSPGHGLDERPSTLGKVQILRKRFEGRSTRDQRFGSGSDQRAELPSASVGLHGLERISEAFDAFDAPNPEAPPETPETIQEELAAEPPAKKKPLAALLKRKLGKKRVQELREESLAQSTSESGPHQLPSAPEPLELPVVEEDNLVDAIASTTDAFWEDQGLGGLDNGLFDVARLPSRPSSAAPRLDAPAQEDPNAQSYAPFWFNDAIPERTPSQLPGVTDAPAASAPPLTTPAPQEEESPMSGELALPEGLFQSQDEVSDPIEADELEGFLLGDSEPVPAPKAPRAPEPAPVAPAPASEPAPAPERKPLGLPRAGILPRAGVITRAGSRARAEAKPSEAPAPSAELLPSVGVLPTSLPEPSVSSSDDELDAAAVEGFLLGGMGAMPSSPDESSLGDAEDIESFLLGEAPARVPDRAGHTTAPGAMARAETPREPAAAISRPPIRETRPTLQGMGAQSRFPGMFPDEESVPAIRSASFEIPALRSSELGIGDLPMLDEHDPRYQSGLGREPSMAGLAGERRGSGYIPLPTTEILDVLGEGQYRLRVEDIIYEPIDEQGLAKLIKHGVLLGAAEMATLDGDWMPIGDHPVFKRLRRRMAREAHGLLANYRSMANDSEYSEYSEALEDSEADDLATMVAPSPFTQDSPTRPRPALAQAVVDQTREVKLYSQQPVREEEAPAATAAPEPAAEAPRQRVQTQQAPFIIHPGRSTGDMPAITSRSADDLATINAPDPRAEQVVETAPPPLTADPFSITDASDDDEDMAFAQTEVVSGDQIHATLSPTPTEQPEATPAHAQEPELAFAATADIKQPTLDELNRAGADAQPVHTPSPEHHQPAAQPQQADLSAERPVAPRVAQSLVPEDEPDDVLMRDDGPNRNALFLGGAVLILLIFTALYVFLMRPDLLGMA